MVYFPHGQSLDVRPSVRPYNIPTYMSSFLTGHAEYLREFPQSSTAPPWLAWPARWPVVQCPLSDICYALPSSKHIHTCSSVIVNLLLSVRGFPTRWNQERASCLLTDAFGPPPRETRSSRQRCPARLLRGLDPQPPHARVSSSSAARVSDGMPSAVAPVASCQHIDESVQ